MCGRYTLSTPGDILAEVFDLDQVPDLTPRYNIAPTQEAAVVRRDREGGNRLGELRWGLVPAWADDPSIGNRMINARAETAAEKPAFGEAFRRRRCLVPADGFYEWKAKGGRKLPYLIRREDGRPMPLAGLWERWDTPEGKLLQTFTILTRPAVSDELASIHDRMPVVLPEPEIWNRWLDRDSDPDDLREMLLDVPPGALCILPVSTRVNKVENDDPGVLAPRTEENEEEEPPAAEQKRLF